jgi:hypothetical protein
MFAKPQNAITNQTDIVVVAAFPLIRRTFRS